MLCVLFIVIYMSLFISLNGEILPENNACISPNNRSFRYGDGCFETMKVISGNVLLAPFHFERLFSSLETLKFTLPDFFTAAYLEQHIKQLVNINQQKGLARVRLVAYAGDGGLYDLDNRNVHFIIQSWPGKSETINFNNTGLAVNIFTDARLPADIFSPIKSNNYLRYAMAALSAKEQGVDDCILTNASGRIADATIANVFIVSNGVIKTPALSEGCVSGVMRKYLLRCFQQEGIPFEETQISPEALLDASEVFLTNANYGIRWVQNVGKINYSNSTSALLHQQFIAPLFQPATF